MARTWSCEICSGQFSALTLKMLVRHISVQHAAMPNFKVKCGVDGCPEKYSYMNSFRKHLRTCHSHEYSDDGNGVQDEEQPRNEDPPPESYSSGSEDDDADDDHDDEVFNPIVDHDDAQIDLKRCAAQFLVKIQRQSKISKVAVNNIIQETGHLVEQVKGHLQKKVIKCINRNDQLTGQLINDVFEGFEDPFSNLQTTSLQSSFIHNHMKYVQPVEYILGSNIGFKNKGAKREICETNDTMVYIPILESIEQLLSNPRIFSLVTNPSKQCKDGVFYDIRDGVCFKTNPIFAINAEALQLILYHDEVEVCNPLGSHVGMHKIDLYYYTLANIDPKFRSKLCAIRLIAIVKAKYVTKYGNGKILTPIVNDLDKLAAGHIFNIAGQPVKMHGAVISCLGDTEGHHQWGGFKGSVGWAHQKCRNCLCSFEDMQGKFRDTQFTSRNLCQYRQQCNDIETAPTEATKKDFQTTYGIVERSCLSDLCHFDITKQLPQDIMHVLLEGSGQYEIRFILQHFFDHGIVTLRQLNNAFCQLSLGYHDEKNRPPPLRQSTFNGQETYKMKQTAEQARIYLKNLPFVLMAYVPVEDLYYQLLLQIISIVQSCFSPVTSIARIQELQDSIESHLKNFKELFPAVNVTPKMHYMIHLPNQILHLGPAVRHSCMRFEARHRYFKDMAPLQNFKNISLSLAERYQLDDCADLSNDNPNHHPLFQTEKEHARTKKLERDELTDFQGRMDDAGLLLNPQMLNQVYSTKWIKLYGATYVPSKGCIIAVDASFPDRIPLFGQLENILLANEEIIFEYIPLKTLEFCSHLMSYKVEKLCDFTPTEFCLCRRMLDFNIYSLVKLNSGLFISLKYDLREIIEQHIVGDNPLHF